MELDEYQSRFAGQEDAAPGWEAIDSRLREVYGEQQPLHWGTAVKYLAGGDDPIDGISAYPCTDGGTNHLHFVTYGYSILYYDEEAVGKDYSGYGFEMTFRLASPLPPEEDPIWVCNLMQNLARYVFNSGKYFSHHQWISSGPIRASGTDIVGLAFVNDPTLGTIETPHGLVEFIQAFGLTQSEVDALKTKSRTCEEILEAHQKTNPLLVTDLSRKDG